MAKVFISSTVYDLIDIRSELKVLLENMNLAPVLSDDATSGFDIETQTNSIETCLVNLRSCDYCIFILDQRYGGKLGGNWGSLSATHVEYNEAIKEEKQILFLVRDKFEADYNIFKAKGEKFFWVKNKELFSFFEEHRVLYEKQNKSKAKEINNWYYPFKNSIELKAIVQNYFKDYSNKIELEKLIHENKVPIFDIKIKSFKSDSNTSNANLRFINQSNIPAYHVTLEGTGLSDNVSSPIVPPNGYLPTLQVFNHERGDYYFEFTLTYYSALGFKFIDTFALKIATQSLKQGLKSRKYFSKKSKVFEIH